MTDTAVSWAFFLGYLALVGGAAAVGIRRVQGFASFSVGDRRTSPVWVGLALAANLTSAATFVINPGLMYLYGLSGLLGYAVATPLGIFLGLAVLTKAFRRVGDKTAALTVPHWIADRYGSRALRFFFAGLSLLQITFLVLIVVGLTLVLSNVLGVSRPVAMAMTLGIPLVYVMWGGASAHTLTNSVQAVIMIVVAVILIGSGIGLVVGEPGLLARLAAIDPVLAAPVNPESLLFRSVFEVFVANFAVGVAVIVQPHVMSKALYLRDERDVNVYLGVGFAALVLFFSVLAVGLYARATLGGDLLPPDQVVPTYLVERFGAVTRSVVTVGLVAAGFSTLEGLLVALSTIFANDVYKPFARRRGVSEEEADGRAIRFSKAFLVALVPVVAVLSWGQIVDPNLSVAILAQNGVYGLFAATFVPILFGVFVPRVTTGGVAAAAVAALLVHFGMYYGEVGPYWNNPAVPATFALATSAAVAGLSLLVARRPPDTEPAALGRAAEAAAPLS
ncbi:sodium:solute symporter [Rubrivirga sp. S365]|uniref:Sodium:solute symporter n=1 Tax=Rubrivirga litoralis TaxID=3075598 RepID=A0ABU3BLH0_9BACT|nr:MULTISPECIES: sodium:solute symporter [unclassified Rubrivirga]MDT0630132.1 sodium:solute symporter [Rubrivirga sp. F394]MDT7855643.1 sodium:solute symporter [Rubrivirga sp. S365]